MEEKTVYEICKLIKKYKGQNNPRFSKNKKIAFAYDYWTISDYDITEIYEYLAENYSKKNYELASLIGAFMDNQQVSLFRNFSPTTYDKKIETILNLTSKVKENGNWLSLYDLEREFTDSSNYMRQIRFSYIIGDNQTFHIDKNEAGKIVGLLTDENIPLATCIVKGAYPYYAHGNLKQYVKTLTSKKA